MSGRAVAGDHNQGVGNDGVHDFLSVGIHQHRPRHGRIVELFKTLLGQMFSGFGEYEIAVVYPQPFFPSGIEQSRVDGSHAGNVGIGFSGHVKAAGAGAFNQRDAFQRIPQASAIDVDNVEGSAADGGGADYFFHRLDGGAGLHASETAHVGVDGKFTLGGDTKHVDDFEPGRSRSVLNAHTDAEAAGIDFVAQPLLNFGDLAGRCRVVRGWPALGQDVGNAGMVRAGRRQRSAEDQRPRCGMAGGGAVVDQRLAVFGLQKLCNIGYADFHFQSSSNAVKGLDTLAFQLLTVLMKVDKSRGNHKIFYTQGPLSAERVGRNPDNLAIADTDVTDRIEASFRIDDAPAVKNDVVLLSGEERGAE